LFFSKVIKLQIEQYLIKLFVAEQASGTHSTLQRLMMEDSGAECAAARIPIDIFA